jgi:penicillin amidase
MGMKAGVSLFRDSNGVAHVQGASLADLYWGQGFAHGTDRLMQMCLMRVIGQGRVCELLKDDDQNLDIDRFFRRMNWSKNIAMELDKLNVEDNTLLGSYCLGINAAMAKSYPWEFRLLGYKPEPWQPKDCILMSRMLGYLTLAQSQSEIERLFIEMVQAGISKTLLDELFPGILGGFDFELINKIKLGERVIKPSTLWGMAAPRMMASNNWVVHGSKTESGKPMLANDPHLEGNRLPNVWYEIVLVANERYMMGASVPGVPGILSGRNNDVAWGVTYAFVDNIDSWVERCEDGRYFREDEQQWHDFKLRNESIVRKKNDPVVATFYENDHGSLDGDPNLPGHYLATRWAAANSGINSIVVAMNMWSIDCVRQGKALVSKIETGWNFVLADEHGAIGFQMSGKVPIRKVGTTGFVPLAGWQPQNDWQGFYPPQLMPNCTNPEQGFFVTANNNLNAFGKINPINICMGSYRADRIAKLLKSESKLTFEAMRNMQFDVYSGQAEAYMAILRPLLPNSIAGNLLKEWDHKYDEKSKGAYLFEMTLKCIYHDVFALHGMGSSVVKYLSQESGIFADFYANFDDVLLQPKSAWFGSLSRDAIFKKALERGLGLSIKTWGQVQKLPLNNIFFDGQMPSILGFDKGPITLIGGRATIHQGQIYRSNGRQTSFMPTIRMISDLAKHEIRSTLLGGPSDRRFSKLYSSDIRNWQRGVYKLISPVPKKRSKFK